MKHLYTLLLCILFLQNKAQHTITAAFNPAVGDIHSEIDLDTTGLFFGSSGTSQVWNYTGISTGTNTVHNFTFIPMSSVIHNSLYPTGTIAKRIGPGGYDFIYKNSSNRIECLGYAQPTATNCQIPIDPVLSYTLPFSFGSLSTDTYSISSWTGGYSGTVVISGDGTGTLQLPSGNYSNVLKMTTYYYASNGPGIVANYFSPISKFPLLTITSSTIGTNILKGGTINALVATSLKEFSKSESFHVFPNPVSNGTLFLNSSPNEAIHHIEIINVLGQTVLSFSAQQLTNAETKKIDVGSLQKGIYYLNIHTAKTSVTKKIIIE